VSAAPRAIRQSQAEQLQGGRAGFVSRVTANGIDFLVVEVIYLAVLFGIAVVRFLITRQDFEVQAPAIWLTVAAQWVIIVLYLGTNWSSTGRTIGKSVLGLCVETTSGAPLGPWRAFVRAMLCATVWAVLLWTFVSRRNAGLHDVLLRTQVVYLWRDTQPNGTPHPVSS
jgi:uncharacterized RDD family membrane protein YckC